MADVLDAAIRSALLTYARSKELAKQDAAAGDDEDPQGLELNSHVKPEDPAAVVKKTKMLRVARMLVDSNPRIRNKGMASVGSFLESSQQLTEDELLHVWSTLYYAAWLTDKPLVQRDFFVRASMLHRRLRCPQAKTLFFCSFFRVLVAEWGKLDRHRTNKFLLFCRIFLAEWMHVMRLLNWEETFVRAAVDFLYEEVMLQSKARGIALHVVDVLTDEFQVLLGAVADSASNNGPSSVAHTPEQEQEERLCAFSWLFVPFLRCCCFSHDSALVSRIHERSLRTVGSQDLDPRFVASTLFALASDKCMLSWRLKNVFKFVRKVVVEMDQIRVRSENRKQLFASHEHVKDCRGGAFGEDDSAGLCIGGFTASSFAELMVQRVISDTATRNQQLQRQPFGNAVKEFPRQRKRQADFNIYFSEADARSSSSDALAASCIGSPISSKDAKDANKRSSMQKSHQQREVESVPSETQAAIKLPKENPVHKSVKNKQRKIYHGSGGEDIGSSAADTASANGLRLPIKSSGNKGVRCSTSDTSSSATGNEASSRSEALEALTVSSVSSAETQSSGHSTPESENSVGDCVSPSMQEPAVPAVMASSGENPGGKLSSRRRSLRISETTPSSKRVLFNLRKNKVVAFSRHAPSLAVGPASPSPPRGASRGSTAEPTAMRDPQPTAVPPRGILREAKKLGPPSGEETAPMPPIAKSNRPPWWGGATAELMAILRRALAESVESSKGDGSTKQKKKKGVKKRKRAAKTRSLPVP